MPLRAPHLLYYYRYCVVIQFGWFNFGGSIIVVVVAELRGLESHRGKSRIVTSLHLFGVFFFFFFRCAKCKRARVSKNETKPPMQANRVLRVCVIKPHCAIKIFKKDITPPGGGGKTNTGSTIWDNGPFVGRGKHDSLTHNAGIFMSRYLLLLVRNWCVYSSSFSFHIFLFVLPFFFSFAIIVIL